MKPEEVDADVIRTLASVAGITVPDEDIQPLVGAEGGTKLRLDVCYEFAGRERFTGVGRERNLLAAFRLRCLPLGESIEQDVPIGPFHSYSNEDHWVERTAAPGFVVIGSHQKVGEAIDIYVNNRLVARGLEGEDDDMAREAWMRAGVDPRLDVGIPALPFVVYPLTALALNPVSGLRNRFTSSSRGTRPGSRHRLSMPCRKRGLA